MDPKFRHLGNRASLLKLFPLRGIEAARTTVGVCYFPKESGNSSWKVDGKRLLGSNGTSEKVVLFFCWKLFRWKFVFHLQASPLLAIHGHILGKETERKNGLSFRDFTPDFRKQFVGMSLVLWLFFCWKLFRWKFVFHL